MRHIDATIISEGMMLVASLLNVKMSVLYPPARKHEPRISTEVSGNLRNGGQQGEVLRGGFLIGYFPPY